MEISGASRMPLPRSTDSQARGAGLDRPMTDAPGEGHELVTEGQGPVRPGPARWAVALATTAAAAIVGSLAVFGIASAVGGSSATEDNAVGVVVGVLLLTALLASLVAFVLALAATLRHERWALLALPLAVFPAVLAFIILGEAFWWE